jgi:TetR/AcrR family transcriptional regulator, transcriptional repressor for nem operon
MEGNHMKVSREQAVKHRARILDVATKRFCEHGFDGIGVADLMQQAGFTHGGFYGHFSSKEELMAQACTRAFAEKAALWQEERELDVDRPLASLATYYLTAAHRDDPGSGCPMAALAIDVSRQAPPVRRAFTEGLRQLVELLTAKLPGRSQAAKRRSALAAWATLVGALILARAVDDPDLSDEMLHAVSASLSAL